MAMEWFFKATHDERIRYMGWTLLLLWTLSITYMTRDFWFPSAYGLPSLMESDRKRKERARKERKRGGDDVSHSSSRSSHNGFY